MIREVFVRTPYNYDTDVASEESGVHCLDDSLAVQSSKDEADINTIVRKFGVTGLLPQGRVLPEYQDLSEAVSDYRESLEIVRAADAAFMTLPAEVRNRFKNDAAAFVDFVTNPDNIEAVREMGLAAKPKEKVNVQDSGKEASDADEGQSGGERGSRARKEVPVQHGERSVGVREADTGDDSEISGRRGGRSR